MKKILLSAFFIILFSTTVKAVPELTLYEPQNITYTEHSIHLNFTSNEVINATIGIDGLTTHIENVDKYFTTLYLKDGLHYLNISVYNENGSDHKEVYFFVDNNGIIYFHDCGYLFPDSVYILDRDVEREMYPYEEAKCLRVMGDNIVVDLNGHNFTVFTKFTVIWNFVMFYTPYVTHNFTLKNGIINVFNYYSVGVFAGHFENLRIDNVHFIAYSGSSVYSHIMYLSDSNKIFVTNSIFEGKSMVQGVLRMEETQYGFFRNITFKNDAGNLIWLVDCKDIAICNSTFIGEVGGCSGVCTNVTITTGDCPWIPPELVPPPPVVKPKSVTYISEIPSLMFIFIITIVICILFEVMKRMKV